MPVQQSVSSSSLQVSLRVRGAGYRRYSTSPGDFHPHYNRHRYRHVLVAFSPGGIIPLPFPFWLGFPEGIVVSCYHLGMVRQYLLEACASDERYLCRVRQDLEQKLTEDADFFVEKNNVKILDYWYDKACVDFSITVEQVLDPPAVCLRPDQTKRFPSVE